MFLLQPVHRVLKQPNGRFFRAHDPMGLCRGNCKPDARARCKLNHGHWREIGCCVTKYPCWRRVHHVPSSEGLDDVFWTGLPVGDTGVTSELLQQVHKGQARCSILPQDELELLLLLLSVTRLMHIIEHICSKDFVELWFLRNRCMRWRTWLSCLMALLALQIPCQLNCPRWSITCSQKPLKTRHATVTRSTMNPQHLLFDLLQLLACRKLHGKSLSS